MTVFQTTCSSITGKVLYSDTYVSRYFEEDTIEDIPLLNRVTAIPVIGHLGALLRIVLSILHMIGHSLAAVIFRDSGHLAHVAKGGAELLRGIIEFIPIGGRIFVWGYDTRDCSTGLVPQYFKVEVGRYFLIKIYNPNEPDRVDQYLTRKGRHPLMQTA